MVDLFCNLGPPNAVPENIAKEWMSLCYVRGVIAQAGFNIGRCDWDDGVDLSVRADKAVLGSTVEATSIGLQLKATKNWRIINGSIHYNIRAKTYERLISKNRLEPLFLVLYPLPSDRNDWLTYAKQNSTDLHQVSVFRYTGYYKDLCGATPLPDGQKNKTISIPLVNHFNQDALLRLYKDHLKDVELVVTTMKNARASKSGGVQ